MARNIPSDYEMHWAFNQCESVQEANRQLREGLIGSVEHARYVLRVWENFKRLPQYEGVVLLEEEK